MAANARSLLLILLVCVLCYAWQADAAGISGSKTSGTVKKSKTVVPKLPATKSCLTETSACQDPIIKGLNGLAYTPNNAPTACRLYATWEICLLDAEQYCPANKWAELVVGAVKNVTGGFELSRDIEKDCCSPLEVCDQPAYVAATRGFTHTDKQCNATEDFWTCTRPVMKTLKTKCHLKDYVDSADGVNDDMKNMLKECDDNGYDVKVDYGQKGGAGLFQGHPLMTLVATVSAILLGVNRFQL